MIKIDNFRYRMSLSPLMHYGKGYYRSVFPPILILTQLLVASFDQKRISLCLFGKFACFGGINKIKKQQLFLRITGKLKNPELFLAIIWNIPINQHFAIEYERKTQNFNTFTANNMGGVKVSPQHSKIPNSIIKIDEASNHEKSLRIKSLKVKLPRPTLTKDKTKNKTKKLTF